MNKWKVALPTLAIALFAAWYAFRPDRLVVDQRLNESFRVVAASAEAVASGTFTGVMHPSTGSATVYHLADGDRILRFSNFKTSNGPDVHVYMVASDDSGDSATVKRADFIDLGTIRGTSAARTTPWAVTWICQNTGRFASGARDSLSISERRP